MYSSVGFHDGKGVIKHDLNSGLSDQVNKGALCRETRNTRQKKISGDEKVSVNINITIQLEIIYIHYRHGTKKRNLR